MNLGDSMKYLPMILIFISINCFSSSLENLVQSIKSNGITISDMHDLHILEKSGEEVGYGLCVAAGRSPRTECDRNGTVGYGLCVIAGRSPTTECSVEATIGYGMCALSGRSPRTECEK